jgi:hypothetical protein
MDVDVCLANTRHAPHRDIYLFLSLVATEGDRKTLIGLV